MGNTLGYSWFLNDNDEQLLDESMRLSQQYVLNLIDQLSAQYNTGDVYLLGFSQGCFLAYSAGISRRDLFSGVICFCGIFDPELLNEDAIRSATDLPILIAHAEDDPMVEFSRGEEARDLLKAYGYEVTFIPFTGGHTLTVDALKQAQDWIEERAADH
jgi:phospholipase/carboxylesterase